MKKHVAVDQFTVDVMSGVEGHCLYVNDLRVAGPKPWGGGRVVHTFKVDRARLMDALGPESRAIQEKDSKP